MKTFEEKDVFSQTTIIITTSNRSDILFVPRTYQRKTIIFNYPFSISPSNCIHERVGKGSLPSQQKGQVESFPSISINRSDHRRRSRSRSRSREQTYSRGDRRREEDNSYSDYSYSYSDSYSYSSRSVSPESKNTYHFANFQLAGQRRRGNERKRIKRTIPRNRFVNDFLFPTWGR